MLGHKKKNKKLEKFLNISKDQEQQKKRRNKWSNRRK